MLQLNFNGILGASPRLTELLEQRNPLLAARVYSTAAYMAPLLELIKEHFPAFTGHDIKHSARVMEHMEKLIPDMELLSDLELAVLAQAALLHDAGMVISSKTEWSAVLEENGCRYRLRSGTEEEAVRDFVRANHGRRSAEFIRRCADLDLSTPPDGAHAAQEYTGVLADICACHQGSLGAIDDLPDSAPIGRWRLNPRFCALVLRIADSLDLSGERTPLQSYEQQQIHAIPVSSVHWRRHLSITAVTTAPTTRGETRIAVHGTCDDPQVHRSYLLERDKLQMELARFVRHFGYCEDAAYRTALVAEVDDQVRAVGFEMSDLTFSIQYDAIVNLLSGETLYEDKRHGLREILQNAIDACRHYRAVLGEDAAYTPQITIRLDEEKGTVSVRDNGSGMSLEIIRDYFLSVGKSYYSSEAYCTSTGGGQDVISHYGIGFLACFMLSGQVTVRTKHYGEGRGHEISLAKNSRYVCISGVDMNLCGTEIILDYREFSAAFAEEEDHLQLEEVLGYLTETLCAPDISILCTDGRRREAIALEITSKRRRHRGKDEFVCLQANELLRDLEFCLFAKEKLWKEDAYATSVFTQRLRLLPEKQAHSVEGLLHSLLAGDGQLAGGEAARSLLEDGDGFPGGIVYGPFAVWEENGIYTPMTEEELAPHCLLGWVEYYSIRLSSLRMLADEIHIMVFTRRHLSTQNGGLEEQDEEAKMFVLQALAACGFSDQIDVAIKFEFYDAQASRLFRLGDRLYHFRSLHCTGNVYLKGIQLSRDSLVLGRIPPSIVVPYTSESRMLEAAVCIHRPELFPTVNRASLQGSDAVEVRDARSVAMLYALYRQNTTQVLRELYRQSLMREVSKYPENRYLNWEFLRQEGLLPAGEMAGI